VITVGTLAVVLAGVAVAYRQYARRDIPVVAPHGRPVTIAARRDLYGDAFNEAAFMRPGQKLTAALGYADSKGVDGVVNGLAGVVGSASARIRKLQTGYVRSYALSMFAGGALLVAMMMLVRVW
jgi:NADH-quinone oxidoreductase subunit L